ncbi:MAG: alpha/beta hydrolase [Candidatus Binataceae bacterium]
MRNLHIVAAVLAVAFIVIIWRLSSSEMGGPPHIDIELRGAIPATLYLPGKQSGFFEALPANEASPRPAIVVVHGYTADRAGMSTLARRLTNNGFAALAIDLRGHGANRNAFGQDFGGRSEIARDVRAAVEYLRGLQYVDSTKIAVMGHSMGAGAVLEYASRDPKLSASVMISGGFDLPPGAHPKDALFIFADGDPDFIKDSSKRIAAQIAGVSPIELGKTYGDSAQGTALQAVEMKGEDHVTIISSEPAAKQMIAWLDSSFGTPRTAPIDLSDPRRILAQIAGLVFLALLVPVGRIAGGFAPTWTRRPAGAEAWLSVVAVAVALLVAMPFVAVMPPAGFIPLEIANVLVSWLLVAGAILMVALVLTGRLDWPTLAEHRLSTLFAASVGFAAIYLMRTPAGVVLHRLVPTPERMIALIVCAALVVPFFVAFELLLRRGGIFTSTTIALAGRIVTLALIWIGAVTGVLPFVVILILPVFGLLFVAMEIFAAAAYSASANLLVIALVESAWLGWVVAAWMPITMKL